MSRHSFDPQVAERVGLNAAVIFQNLKWWCEKNAANKKNMHDNKAWTFNSLSAFQDLFPYLSPKQIRSALDRLEEEGLVEVGNFNKDARDRTKWYAVAGDCICPTGQTDLPSGADTFALEGRPLPDSKPVINTVGKHPPNPPEGAGQFNFGDDPNVVRMPPKREQEKLLEEEFDQVWEYYPRKVSRKDALIAWKKARKKLEFDEIAKPLGMFIRCVKGTPKDKIPHFATWLNKERWTDDQTHARNAAMTSDQRLDGLMQGGGAPQVTSDDRLNNLFPQGSHSFLEHQKGGN